MVLIFLGRFGIDSMLEYHCSFSFQMVSEVFSSCSQSSIHILRSAAFVWSLLDEVSISEYSSWSSASYFSLKLLIFNSIISISDLRFQKNFFPIIKESISILNASPKLQNKLQNTKLIQSKRQPQSLKRILTRAKFTTGDPIVDKPKVSKCNDKRCQTCKHIVECSQVEINKTSITTFNIKNNMNCGVRDLIYVITCNGCEEKYIGESGDTL